MIVKVESPWIPLQNLQTKPALKVSSYNWLSASAGRSDFRYGCASFDVSGTFIFPILILLYCESRLPLCFCLTFLEILQPNVRVSAWARQPWADYLFTDILPSLSSQPRFPTIRNALFFYWTGLSSCAAISPHFRGRSRLQTFPPFVMNLLIVLRVIAAFCSNFLVMAYFLTKTAYRQLCGKLLQLFPWEVGSVAVVALSVLPSGSSATLVVSTSPSKLTPPWSSWSRRFSLVTPFLFCSWSLYDR